MMDLIDFQSAIGMIGRELHEAICERDLLIVHTRLGLREQGIEYENDRILEDINGDGPLGAATRRITDIERRCHCLGRQFSREARVARSRELTAGGLSVAILKLLRAHSRPMRSDDVEVGLNVIGFDTESLGSPTVAVAEALRALTAAGRLGLDPETNSYR